MSHFDDQMEWLQRHAQSGPSCAVCHWAWHEIKRLVKERDALAAELARLRRLEAALPKTADGVAITPAIRGVYRPITIRGRNEVQESKPFYLFATFDSIADGEPVIGPVYINPSLCYSSREAAEKAMEA